MLDEIALVESTVHHHTFLSGYLVLARAAFLRDDLDRVLTVLDRGVQLARERGWRRLVADFLIERARLLAGHAAAGELRKIVDEIAAVRSANAAPTLSADLATASTT